MIEAFEIIKKIPCTRDLSERSANKIPLKDRPVTTSSVYTLALKKCDRNMSYYIFSKQWGESNLSSADYELSRSKSLPL